MANKPCPKCGKPKQNDKDAYCRPCLAAYRKSDRQKQYNREYARQRRWEMKLGVVEVKRRYEPKCSIAESEIRFCYVALLRALLERSEWLFGGIYPRMEVLIERGHVECDNGWVKLNKEGAKYWAREVDMDSSYNQKQSKELREFLGVMRGEE